MKNEERNIVRLTESQMHQLITESVMQIINEMQSEDGEMDEGFLDRLKTGANTFFGRDKGSLGKRWNNAKANYRTQGELDTYSDLIKQLSDLIDQRKISPDTTVAQLVGGKYNNNKFGTMTGMVGNRKTQLRNRGYTGKF